MCEPTWASFGTMVVFVIAAFAVGVLWELERAWEREDRNEARKRAHRLREKEGQQ